MSFFDWQEDGVCPELAARHFRAWSNRVRHLASAHPLFRIRHSSPHRAQSLIVFPPGRAVGPSGLTKLREWVADPTLGAMRHFEDVKQYSIANPCCAVLQRARAVCFTMLCVRSDQSCIRQLCRAERLLEHHQGWRDLCDGFGHVCSRLFGAPAVLFKSIPSLKLLAMYPPRGTLQNAA